VGGRRVPREAFRPAAGGHLNPFVSGSGFRWGHLAVIAVWGAAAAVVAVQRFQWEPRATVGARPRRQPTS